jgi:hypothetical protein
MSWLPGYRFSLFDSSGNGPLDPGLTQSKHLPSYLELYASSGSSSIRQVTLTLFVITTIIGAFPFSSSLTTHYADALQPHYPC